MNRRQFIGALMVFGLFLLTVPALLFLSAGTLDWPMAWVYAGLLVGSSVVSRLIVFKHNPDTLRERARFLSSEGTKSWDRVLVVLLGIVGPIAITVIAGLDRRWGWTEIVPLSGQILAALAIAAGYGLGVWAMVENAYFSAVARIQADRAQTVVTTGPYRFMRHPSYAGAVLAYLAFPFMLDALWTLIPAVIMAAVTIVRTSFEDRMLREELEGYQEYADQTRYRLLPGVW